MHFIFTGEMPQDECYLLYIHCLLCQCVLLNWPGNRLLRSSLGVAPRSLLSERWRVLPSSQRAPAIELPAPQRWTKWLCSESAGPQDSQSPSSTDPVVIKRRDKTVTKPWNAQDIGAYRLWNWYSMRLCACPLFYEFAGFFFYCFLYEALTKN